MSLDKMPPLYNTWSMIKQRCYNKKHPAYPYYGGRGIKMCDEWKNSFAQFAKDVGDRPTPRHTVDRHPNKDGDYEPSNFRWATMKEQAENKNLRNTIKPEGKRSPRGPYRSRKKATE